MKTFKTDKLRELNKPELKRLTGGELLGLAGQYIEVEWPDAAAACMDEWLNRRLKTLTYDNVIPFRR